MAKIIVIDSKYALALKGALRDKDNSTDTLQTFLYQLGSEIGKICYERYYITLSEVVTPMQHKVTTLIPKKTGALIFTTKNDFEYLGRGLVETLKGSKLGFMDFEGTRGKEALQGPIRVIEPPQIKNQAINQLIISKAVLATGCTAISLTRNAIAKYTPEKLVICAIFYSNTGLSDLVEEFPNADYILIGEEDDINDDGMLIPGLGNLDQRLKGA